MTEPGKGCCGLNHGHSIRIGKYVRVPANRLHAWIQARQAEQQILTGSIAGLPGTTRRDRPRRSRGAPGSLPQAERGAIGDPM